MKRRRRSEVGITLVEAMIAIVIMIILAAIIFPVLSSAKKRAHRATCMNNLRQINLGVRMYSDDSEDQAPSPGTTAASTNFISLYSGYKQLMKTYVGADGSSSAGHKIFACPADTFYPSFLLPNSTTGFYVRDSLHRQPAFDYSSYTFNGGDNVTRKFKSWSVEWPGLTGLKLSNIRNPSRTILVAEVAALGPWSWHDHRAHAYLTYNDAKTMVSFVDGHVSYIRMFWNTAVFEAKGPSFAMNYNPPAGYDYQWSGD